MSFPAQRNDIASAGEWSAGLLEMKMSMRTSLGLSCTEVSVKPAPGGAELRVIVEGVMLDEIIRQLDDARVLELIGKSRCMEFFGLPE